MPRAAKQIYMKHHRAPSYRQALSPVVMKAESDVDDDVGSQLEAVGDPAVQQLLRHLYSENQRLQTEVETLKTAATTTPSEATTRPLKAVIFVDGTWLYYSLFERKFSSLTERFGESWFRTFGIDWQKLPLIVSRCLQDQLAEYQPEGITARQVEVVRSIVYTSCRKETPRLSPRRTLFEDMALNPNFEVHMATMKGDQEKGVDINLAVAMMEWATLPDAMDIAVVLTGDKDQVPAMQRTRNKGKRVALVALRPSLSAELTQSGVVQDWGDASASAKMRDFHPIFLDDHLDELMVPLSELRPQEEDDTALLVEAAVDIVRRGMIEEGGLSMSSREFGRQLQNKPGHGNYPNMLAVLRSRFSTRSFVEHFSSIFVAEDIPNDDPRGRRTSRTEFRVALREGYDQDVESPFDSAESDWDAGDRDQKRILFDLDDDDDDGTHGSPLKYGELLKDKLKELCRERGISRQGLKADLIARLQKYDQDQILEASRAEGLRSPPSTPSRSINNTRSYHQYSQASDPAASFGGWVDSGISDEEREAVGKELRALIVHRIDAAGGTLSSRDIGRFLASKRVGLDFEYDETALETLKRVFLGVKAFLSGHPTDFDLSPVSTNGAFLVTLLTPSPPRTRRAIYRRLAASRTSKLPGTNTAKAKS